jgi:hypothetical protein
MRENRVVVDTEATVGDYLAVEGAAERREPTPVPVGRHHRAWPVVVGFGAASIVAAIAALGAPSQPRAAPRPSTAIGALAAPFSLAQCEAGRGGCLTESYRAFTPTNRTTCAPWTSGAEVSPQLEVSDVGTVRQGPDGVVSWLSFRDCLTGRKWEWSTKAPWIVTSLTDDPALPPG